MWHVLPATSLGWSIYKVTGCNRFKSGDYVEGTKAGKVARGWIGGYTNRKTKAVSIYDANWKRIGQFSPNKTKLLKRSTGLCIA